MKLKVIKTEKEYRTALRRLEELFDAMPGTEAADELEVLGLLVDDYENQHYPVDAPDPIEAIKIRMEEMNLRQVDLIPDIGTKSRVSEVLNRKRRLTIGMIRSLSRRLGLPAQLLIQDYQMAE